MQTKQWKGRKRPKIIEADPASEVKLAELIAERPETSDEEEENDHPGKDDAFTVMKFTTIASADSHCVWGEVPPREEVRKSQSKQEKGVPGCVWKAGVIIEEQNGSTAESPITFKSSTKRKSHGSELSLDPKKVHISDDLEVLLDRRNYSGRTHDQVTIERETASHQTILQNSYPRKSLADPDLLRAELEALLPEDEVAELFETDDLLFCSKPVIKEAGKAKVEEKTDRTEHPTRSQARRSVRRSVRHMAGASDADLAGSTFKEELVIESNRKKTAPATNTSNRTELDDVFTCITPITPVRVGVVGKKDCMKTPSPPSLFFNRVAKLKSKGTRTKRRISNDKICGGDILKDISNTHTEPKLEKQEVVVRKPNSGKTNKVNLSSRNNHGIEKRSVKTKTVHKDISNTHTEPKLEKQVVVVEEQQESVKISKVKVTSRRKNQGHDKHLVKTKTVPKKVFVESKISSQEEEMKEKVPVKRQRRSYSMGDTDHRFSLDGSNKNRY